MRWTSLLRKLWHDDCGAIITAEYMMVFGIMTLGAAQGLSSMRDAATQEMQETGAAVREARLYYTPTLGKAKSQGQVAPPSALQLPTGGSQCPGGACP